MVSTFLTYRTYAQNLPRTLTRIASQREIGREEEYYQANIGKVTSVDEFLDNRRLFAYAMKAHGLEDMTYAKAFMRKVLESDIDDAKSFARQLVDTRYVAFARAFNFGADGKVQANLPFVQNDFQEADTIGLYSEHRVRQGAAAASEAQYYQTRIAALTSVDDLIADERLFTYALTAYGIDASIASEAAIRSVLTSDLADPSSAANQMGNARYVALAAAFSFEADGSVAAGGAAQTAAQLSETIFRNYESTGNGSSPAAAAFRSDYYRNAIAGVTSVDDLLGNERMLGYALLAYGINPNLVTPATIRQVLTSDLSDPGSFANSITDTRYRTLAAAFNFATDGTISGSEGAQSAAEIEGTVDRYLANYDDAAEAADAAASTFYHNRINLMTSVDALMDNDTLYTYVLEAFDLDPDVESKSKIRQVLVSDASDPLSFANRQSDQRYRDLAAAFNFAPDGSVLTPRKAQTDDAELGTIQLYNTRIGSTDAEQAQAVEDNTYYHSAIIKVRSLDDLLGDERLVAYVLKAYGLEGESISTATLRSVLTSDPLDRESFVGKSGDERLRDMAAAFNFTSDGRIARVPEVEVQSRGNLLKTGDLYIRQSMEAEAGAQNEGVRLALYFKRKAASISTAFDILADKAVFEVVRTALNLPASMSQADIEVQAQVLIKRINPADFRDTTKLDKFITRFCAMYDLNNGGTATLSAATVILGGGQANIGTNQSLLARLQGV
jgi:hypothetical protein